MWVDKSYFFDKLTIDHNSVGANDKLYRYIAEYTKVYGVKMFGLGNWNIITNNIDNPDYSYLVELLRSQINSPIACFVFWNYQFQSVVHASGMGDVRSTTDNAHLVSATFRMRIAYNSMVDANREIKRYLYDEIHKHNKFEDLDKHTLFRDKSMFQKENDWGI